MTYCSNGKTFVNEVSNEDMKNILALQKKYRETSSEDFKTLDAINGDLKEYGIKYGGVNNGDIFKYMM